MLPIPPDWALTHAFHPGRWVALTHNDACIGIVGELHPAVVASTDLPEAAVTFHVDLQALLDWRPETRRFSPPPRYPSVEYHINVLAPARLFSADLLDLVKGAELGHLHHAGLRSVYTGAGVPAGSKRITLALEFNHPDRSLTHEEAMNELDKLAPCLAPQGLTVEI